MGFDPRGGVFGYWNFDFNFLIFYYSISKIKSELWHKDKGTEYTRMHRSLQSYIPTIIIDVMSHSHTVHL